MGSRRSRHRRDKRQEAAELQRTDVLLEVTCSHCKETITHKQFPESVFVAMRERNGRCFAIGPLHAECGKLAQAIAAQKAAA